MTGVNALLAPIDLPAAGRTVAKMVAARIARIHAARRARVAEGDGGRSSADSQRVSPVHPHAEHLRSCELPHTNTAIPLAA